MADLKEDDPVISYLIKQEFKRQSETLNMIPSENTTSNAVMEACGSVLMNKYAEGYPGKRYYQGNKFVDSVETIAIDRAKALFSAEHVNVQPYSGSPANLAVFLAFLKPGDTFMGLDLACGGHLTHGSPVNFSGSIYRVVSYGVDKSSGLIDMDAVRQIALREKPKLIISGLTAYPRQIDFLGFQKIAEEVGAIHLADISHIAGLVAAGVHPSPLPFTDVVTTTTHKTLRGPRGAMIMCKEKYAKQIDRAVFPGMQGGPHENTIAGKAVAFQEALRIEFKTYVKQIVKNAKVLAETLKAEGIKLVTDGTDNHLMLIDLTPMGIGLGKPMAEALEEAGICLNANSIPYDPSTPFKPSGLRLGTPMLTTRGMGEQEMQQIGKWIASVVKDSENKSLKEEIKLAVRNLCLRFPIEGMDLGDKKGKLIVIDGTDGTGKATQLNLLKQRLEREGYKVATADFPQYGKNVFADSVGAYLRSEFGNAAQLNPYLSSFAYAGDRWKASGEIREALNKGQVVITNRYTSANMGHQGSKFDSSLEREAFLNWLRKVEFSEDGFGIPKPDCTIILHLNPEMARRLVDMKSAREYIGGLKRDAHEADLVHQRRTAETFKEIAKSDSSWRVIECADFSGNVLTPETIHELVWNEVKAVLN